jgi:addiction module HigA family antidote
MDFVAYLDWLVASADAMGSRAKSSRVPPRHPGVVLQSEYLTPRGMSQSELARRAKTTAAKINEIVNGKRGVSAAFALALEEVLGTPASLWLSLQAEYELDQARRRRSRSRR